MVKMKDPKFFDEAFNKIIKYYIDLNKNVFKDIFFAKILEENGDNIFITNSFNQEIQPILIGQMGVLYKLCPFKYSGMINDDFLNFISINFKNNVVFLTTDDGFLVYIMLINLKRSLNGALRTYQCYPGMLVQQHHRWLCLTNIKLVIRWFNRTEIIT